MQQQDPSVQWASHLRRLGPSRREAVTGALRHSASTGWPASERGVELLVGYALGEITATSYVAGILSSLGFSAGDPVDEPDEAPLPAPIPIHGAHRVGREDVVQAYVTGQIDVSEFLRIARA